MRVSLFVYLISILYIFSIRYAFHANYTWGFAQSHSVAVGASEKTYANCVFSIFGGSGALRALEMAVFAGGSGFSLQKVQKIGKKWGTP